MKKELVKSAGMIVFRRRYDEIQFLVLFQRDSQTWSFPKGKIEPQEKDLDAARREVFEEIGQEINPLDDFKAELTYPISQNRTKNVTLYLAEINGSVELKDKEIDDYRWVTAGGAIELLQHKQYKEILENAENRILSEFLGDRPPKHNDFEGI